MHKLRLILLFIFVTISVQNIFSQAEQNNEDFKHSIEVIRCYKCDDIAVSLPSPKYPTYIGNGQHIYNGEVSVQVVIDKKGNVESAKGVSGHPFFGPLLEKESLKAKFKPRIVSGKPTKTNAVIVYKVTSIDSQEKSKKDAQDDNTPTISLGVLNDKVKLFPVPKVPKKLANIEATGKIVVSIKLNMQTGRVVSAKAFSGFDLYRKYVVEAALKAEFQPTLTEFSTIYGTGVLVYSRKDFNRKTIENKNAKPLIKIIARGVLNDNARNFQKPTGNCVSGNMEVAVLVNARSGNVISAKAILGEAKSKDFVENSALETKFLGFRDSPSNLFVQGKLIYHYAVKRCSKGIVNGKTIYFPPPEVEDLNISEEFEVSDKHIVVVFVQIENEGNVISAKAVRGHPLLREICEEAARKAVFIPKKSKYAKFWEGVLVYSFNSDLTLNIKHREENTITISHFPPGTKPIFEPKVKYPIALRNTGFKERLVVQILVSEKGIVEEAKVISGHPLLRKAVLEAAKLTRFNPQKLNNKPVKVRGSLVYNFY